MQHSYILDIPLYYISFNENRDIESHLKDVGFTNINHFPAIDGRKNDIVDLIENNLITIRSYNDLSTQREQHSGLPTLGAVGCTMSHDALWRKCATDPNLPYLIIVEDDVYFKKKIDQNDLNFFHDTLQNNPKSIIISPHYFDEKSIDNNLTTFMGSHFYIVTKPACQEIIKYTFPIDVQTDFFLANLYDRKKFNLFNYKIAFQKQHKSQIQTDDCFKCNLPKSWWTYFFFFLAICVVFVTLIISFIFLLKKLKKCKETCPYPK